MKVKRLISCALALVLALSPVAAQSSGGPGSGGSSNTQSSTQSSDGQGSAGSGSATQSEVADQLDPSLFAVGSLGASNLYFSYVVLGTVADGFASRGYGKDMARSLAEEAIALNRGSRNALQTLIDQGRVADADRDVVSEMIEAHGLLIQQAQGLLSYIEDRSQTEQFQRYRQRAWEKISAVLGIPEGGRQAGSSGQNGSGSGESGNGSASNGSGSGGSGNGRSGSSGGSSGGGSGM
jgi:hypothetical protein